MDLCLQYDSTLLPCPSLAYSGLPITAPPLAMILVTSRKKNLGDFPGFPVVKNSSCNAGDMGLIPGQGIKIPHASEQLSPHVKTKESVHHSERSHMV